MNGRLLGIDHGIKRIGLAVCDASRMIASELTVLQRTTRQADFEALVRIIAREKVVGIVIGIPTHNSPTGAHTQADTVRLWITRLRAFTDLPIVEWEESLTSEDAKELAHLQKRKQGAPLDDLAARLILQSYLDALHDGLATFP